MDWWSLWFACAALLALGIPIRGLWRLAVKPKLVQMPKPGEFWVFRGRSEGDPWAAEGGHQVEVLDVRAGWVRYRFTTSRTYHQDERMEADSFRYCYQPTNGS